MLMLAMESSAKAASVALVRDGILLAQSVQNSGLTHSRTLLPMAEDLLKNAGISLSEIDCYAVARGPGSFTGVRIGVSAVKGLAWASEKPAVGVSTLEAMAWNGVDAGEGTLICCCMDARRSQVYNALFEVRDGKPLRLTEDRAISVEALLEELESNDWTPFLVGDGAELCAAACEKQKIAAVLAPGNLRMQCAWGVAMAAQDAEFVSADALQPVYLRLSQAERERQARLEQESHNH